jgi:tetratricopeptide (TPR) repeat protein
MRGTRIFAFVLTLCGSTGHQPCASTQTNGVPDSFVASEFEQPQTPVQLVRSQNLNDQGEFRTVAYLLQPLTRDEQTLSPSNRGVALNILGSAYQSLEDFGRPRRCYEQSIHILKDSLPPQTEYASTMNNLGSLERMEGDPKAARKLWVRARGVYQAGGRHGSLAVIANDLSLLDLAERDIRAAHIEMTEAFRQGALAERFKNNDYAVMYTTKGSVAEAEGDLKGAIAAYDTAIEIWTRDHGKGFYMVGAGYALRAAEFDKLGDSARAIEDLKFALAILAGSIGKGTVTHLRVETNYARVLRRTGAKEEVSRLDKEVRAAMSTARRQQCNGCRISAESVR